MLTINIIGYYFSIFCNINDLTMSHVGIDYIMVVLFHDLQGYGRRELEKVCPFVKNMDINLLF